MTPLKKPICAVKPLANNHPRQQYGRRDDKNTYAISLEGLPQGSTPAQVVRCILLLEHVLICNRLGTTCAEGEGCRRTKQVLLHHLSCKSRQSDCNACLQLMALCRIHSENCQETKGNCNVLYCKNKKSNLISSDQQPQLSMKTQQYSIFTKKQKMKKFEEVIKKLLGLPIEHQKIKIAHLLQTNPQVASHVLRILRTSHRSRALLCHERNILTTNKGRENISQRDVNHKMYSATEMKLDVVIQAFAKQGA